MKSIRPGDKIAIGYSKKLEEVGSHSLVNRRGTVTRLVTVGRRVIGAYVDVKLLKRTRNYFIPTASIISDEELDRQKSYNLLQTIEL